MNKKKETSLTKSPAQVAVNQQTTGIPAGQIKPDSIANVEFQRSMTIGQKVSHYPSILPDPNDLERYEKIRIGSFDIILEMIQEEQSQGLCCFIGNFED